MKSTEFLNYQTDKANKPITSEDSSDGASCSSSIAAGPAGSLFAPIKRTTTTTKKKVKNA